MTAGRSESPSTELDAPNRMPIGAFEASLPRAAYVDPAYLDRERDGIFWSEWVVAGRVEQVAEPGDFLALDVAGEQVIVVRNRSGEISAHYDVCRHRGSRLTTPDQRADPATVDPAYLDEADDPSGNLVRQPGAPGPSGRFKGVIRCPYHSWCYELDGRVRNAPFLGESDAFEPAAFGLYPVAVDAWGGLAVRQPVAGAGRRGLHAGGTAGRDPGAHRALPAGRPADRAPDRLRRARQLEGHRRELQRVLPLLGRAPGAVPDRAGVPREGRRQPRLGRGHPAGRGHLHVHHDRPLGPRAVPGPRRRRAGPAQGRARLPEPDAQPVRRPRRRRSCWCPRRPTGPSSSSTGCSTPTRSRRPTFDPSDAVDFWDLVNRQDWAVCEGVQSGMSSRRFRFGWYAPMEDLSLDIRRYVGERLRPGGGRGRQRPAGRPWRPRMTRDWDVVVVGLGALGSAAAYWCSRRTGTRVLALERFEIGHHHGASEDVSRIIRRSYHRRDYVRLTARAYEAWAEVERASGTQVVFRTGGLDVGPRETATGVAIDIGEYARSMTAEGVPFEQLDGAEIVRRWPAWRLDDGHVGLFQADAGLADPSRGNVAHRRLATRARARCCASTRPVARIDERRAARPSWSLEDGERLTAGRVIVAADAWTNDLLEPLGAGLPLTVTQEQVQLVHAARRPGAVRPGPVPGLDLDGRAVVLRLPDPRAPGPQDRPGRRRPARSPRRPARSSATRPPSRG